MLIVSGRAQVGLGVKRKLNQGAGIKVALVEATLMSKRSFHRFLHWRTRSSSPCVESRE